MTKRILIICEAIAPPAYSPRILTLVEYLQQKGWHCEIATEMDHDRVFETDICTIHQMPTYKHLIADKIFDAKEKVLYRYVCKQVDVASFDLILCASYYYFPLQAAMRLAKKYRLPFVVDLRDITEQWGQLDYYTRSFTGIKFVDSIAKKVYTTVNTYKRNRVLRAASAVTTVSPWHKQMLQQYNKQTQLIYNGFDCHKFYPNDVISKNFEITFIGKYYAHYADCPTLLFLALQQLIAEEKILSEDIRVLFYTNEVGQKTFSELAEKHTLKNIVAVHDYIPRHELVAKMHHSSILMVLTTPAKQNGTHGIMGTKFYEILGVEKPCLCLYSDEECLAEAIVNTKAGLAATNIEEVKDFILEKYNEWKSKGYTHQAVINKEQFTRQHEAQQFEQLFLACIQ